MSNGLNVNYITKSKTFDYLKIRRDSKTGERLYYNGPGAGKYFPNYNLTLSRRPAYSMGAKLPDPSQLPKSPGPIYFPDYKVQRTGKEKTPAYVIVGRPKPNELFTSPGPAAYAPEKHSDPSKSNRPAYTLGIKHRHLEVSPHPVGPNQYEIKNTIGSLNYSTKILNSPSFSIPRAPRYERIEV